MCLGLTFMTSQTNTKKVLDVINYKEYMCLGKAARRKGGSFSGLRGLRRRGF